MVLFGEAKLQGVVFEVRRVCSGNWFCYWRLFNCFCCFGCCCTSRLYWCVWLSFYSSLHIADPSHKTFHSWEHLRTVPVANSVYFIPSVLVIAHCKLWWTLGNWLRANIKMVTLFHSQYQSWPLPPATACQILRGFLIFQSQTKGEEKHLHEHINRRPCQLNVSLTCVPT